MSSIQQLAVKLNEDSVRQLISNVRAMPEDKVSWQPMDTGRTALSQLQECAIICGMTIRTLQTHAIPQDFNEVYGKELAELDTVDKAIQRLEERSGDLSAVIRAVPDSDLEKTVQLPWSQEPSSLAEIMFMNYWNTVYHVGQISYIQTLYGDNEMH